MPGINEFVDQLAHSEKESPNLLRNFLAVFQQKAKLIKENSEYQGSEIDKPVQKNNSDFHPIFLFGEKKQVIGFIDIQTEDIRSFIVTKDNLSFDLTSDELQELRQALNTTISDQNLKQLYQHYLKYFLSHDDQEFQLISTDHSMTQKGIEAEVKLWNIYFHYNVQNPGQVTSFQDFVDAFANEVISQLAYINNLFDQKNDIPDTDDHLGRLLEHLHICLNNEAKISLSHNEHFDIVDKVLNGEIKNVEEIRSYLKKNKSEILKSQADTLTKEVLENLFINPYFDSKENVQAIQKTLENFLRRKGVKIEEGSLKKCWESFFEKNLASLSDPQASITDVIAEIRHVLYQQIISDGDIVAELEAVSDQLNMHIFEKAVKLFENAFSKGYKHTQKAQEATEQYLEFFKNHLGQFGTTESRMEILDLLDNISYAIEAQDRDQFNKSFQDLLRLIKKLDKTKLEQNKFHNKITEKTEFFIDTLPHTLEEKLVSEFCYLECEEYFEGILLIAHSVKTEACLKGDAQVVEQAAHILQLNENDQVKVSDVNAIRSVLRKRNEYSSGKSYFDTPIFNKKNVINVVRDILDSEFDIPKLFNITFFKFYFLYYQAELANNAGAKEALWKAIDYYLAFKLDMINPEIRQKAVKEIAYIIKCGHIVQNLFSHRLFAELQTPNLKEFTNLLIKQIRDLGKADKNEKKSHEKRLKKLIRENYEMSELSLDKLIKDINEMLSSNSLYKFLNQGVVEDQIAQLKNKELSLVEDIDASLEHDPTQPNKGEVPFLRTSQSLGTKSHNQANNDDEYAEQQDTVEELVEKVKTTSYQKTQRSKQTYSDDEYFAQKNETNYANEFSQNIVSHAHVQNDFLADEIQSSNSDKIGPQESPDSEQDVYIRAAIAAFSDVDGLQHQWKEFFESQAVEKNQESEDQVEDSGSQINDTEQGFIGPVFQPKTDMSLDLESTQQKLNDIDDTFLAIQKLQNANDNSAGQPGKKNKKKEKNRFDLDEKSKEEFKETLPEERHTHVDTAYEVLSSDLDEKIARFQSGQSLSEEKPKAQKEEKPKTKKSTWTDKKFKIDHGGSHLYEPVELSEEAPEEVGDFLSSKFNTSLSQLLHQSMICHAVTDGISKDDVENIRKLNANKIINNEEKELIRKVRSAYDKLNIVNKTFSTFSGMDYDKLLQELYTLVSNGKFQQSQFIEHQYQIVSLIKAHRDGDLEKVAKLEEAYKFFIQNFEKESAVNIDHTLLSISAYAHVNKIASFILSDLIFLPSQGYKSLFQLELCLFLFKTQEEGEHPSDKRFQEFKEFFVGSNLSDTQIKEIYDFSLDLLLGKANKSDVIDIDLVRLKEVDSYIAEIKELYKKIQENIAGQGELKEAREALNKKMPGLLELLEENVANKPVKQPHDNTVYTYILDLSASKYVDFIHFYLFLDRLDVIKQHRLSELIQKLKAILTRENVNKGLTRGPEGSKRLLDKFSRYIDYAQERYKQLQKEYEGWIFDDKLMSSVKKALANLSIENDELAHHLCAAIDSGDEVLIWFALRLCNEAAEIDTDFEKIVDEIANAANSYKPNSINPGLYHQDYDRDKLNLPSAGEAVDGEVSDNNENDSSSDDTSAGDNSTGEQNSIHKPVDPNQPNGEDESEPKPIDETVEPQNPDHGHEQDTPYYDDEEIEESIYIDPDTGRAIEHPFQRPEHFPELMPAESEEDIAIDEGENSGEANQSIKFVMPHTFEGLPKVDGNETTAVTGKQTKQNSLSSQRHSKTKLKAFQKNKSFSKIRFNQRILTFQQYKTRFIGTSALKVFGSNGHSSVHNLYSQGGNTSSYSQTTATSSVGGKGSTRNANGSKFHALKGGGETYTGSVAQQQKPKLKVLKGGQGKKSLFAVKQRTYQITQYANGLRAIEGANPTSRTKVHFSPKNMFISNGRVLPLSSQSKFAGRFFLYSSIFIAMDLYGTSQKMNKVPYHMIEGVENAFYDRMEDHLIHASAGATAGLIQLFSSPAVRFAFPAGHVFMVSSLAVMAGMLLIGGGALMAKAIKDDLARIRRENTPDPLQSKPVESSLYHLDKLIVSTTHTLLHIEKQMREKQVAQQKQLKKLEKALGLLNKLKGTKQYDKEKVKQLKARVSKVQNSSHYLSREIFGSEFFGKFEDHNRKIKRLYGAYIENGSSNDKMSQATELLKEIAKHPYIMGLANKVKQNKPEKWLNIQQALQFYRQKDTSGQLLAMNFGQYQPEEVIVQYKNPIVTGIKRVLQKRELENGKVDKRYVYVKQTHREFHYKREYLVNERISTDKKEYMSYLKSFQNYIEQQKYSHDRFLDKLHYQDIEKSLKAALEPKPYVKAVIIEKDDKVYFYDKWGSKVGSMKLSDSQKMTSYLHKQTLSSG